jgi:beta-galactosidase
MKNGVNIVGATKASYTTPSTVPADNGSLFSVKVSNAAGSATSNNALLTVK